ncbi:DinB family protein [Deinococcus sp. VB343]|uniref:DinB family protein n=1 Tax=Deinococcus sp. VB142 TaxID=3112952 RepID=A0AAU6PYI3_9DEIO
MTNLDLLLESFVRNARVNEFLLGHLTEADLPLSDGHGGMTVGQHLSHIASFRGGWLAAISPEHAAATGALAGEKPIWEWQTDDLKALREMFTVGDRSALEAVMAHLQSGEPFADPWKEGAYGSNPAHFLQHTIVHDSHHRGQIMSLLRINGRSKEQMDELDAHWAIWRE